MRHGEAPCHPISQWVNKPTMMDMVCYARIDSITTNPPPSLFQKKIKQTNKPPSFPLSVPHLNAYCNHTPRPYYPSVSAPLGAISTQQLLPTLILYPFSACISSSPPLLSQHLPKSSPSASHSPRSNTKIPRPPS